MGGVGGQVRGQGREQHLRRGHPAGQHPPASLGKDLDAEIPPGSHILLASGKSTVHEAASALACDELSFVSLDQVQDIAGKVAEVWLDLHGRLQSDAADADLADSVHKALLSAGVLPSQVVQALSGRLF